ncbi:MAG: CBS domain-containing protein [Chloroflexi bacterium]|nr:CBS domain-containing protein [Chloroflexota bacterium]
MLIRDIMTTKVVTAPSHTPINDARKIMKEGNFRRLPVVDNGKLVGVVTEDRLERVAPKTGAPVLWQISYLVSHTTLRDVMAKKVVTIKPDATVEQGVALAQRTRVGSLVVVEKGKVVGIVTTNDFFYRIVNPTLGVGEPGIRLIVVGGGDGKDAEAVIGCINRLGIGIKLIWTLPPSGASKKDIIVQLDTEDATAIIGALEKLGYSVGIRAR